MSSPTFVLSTLDVLVIVGSLLAVVLVGLWAGRGQSQSARAYFLASDRMPWWIIGSAFVSTSISSEQLAGTVGATYEYGMALANWEWFSLPTYTLLLVFFIPVYLRNRITTVPEYLSRRFGPLCGDMYSWMVLPFYVLVFLVSVLYSSSLVISSLTGWNFYFVLWTTAAVVGVYTIKGGLSSVMWTDALQCVMLVSGGIILYFISLDHIPGGWAAMAAANPERFHLYRPPDDPIAPFLAVLCGAFTTGLFYQSSNQVMMQRVLAARSTWDGLMGIIFAGFINLVRPLVTCFLGLIVYHWIHEMKQGEPLQNPDTAFSFALTEFAPAWGLRGIVLAGFLAAVMSSVSAIANSSATIFALDIYKRICPDADDRQLVRVGQNMSLLTLVIASLVCPVVAYLGGIFRYFQNGVTILAVPFISVILLGILWKRTNFPAAVFGIVGGLAIEGIVALAVPMLGLELDHWLYKAFISEIIIMAGIVAVSLATAPPAREQVEGLVWQPTLLNVHKLDAGKPWYHSVLVWFGLYAAVWFYLYWKFW